MAFTPNSTQPVQSYQSKSVWVTSGDYASNQTISGSLVQLSRVQAADWSVSYGLVDNVYLDGEVDSFYPVPNGVDVNYRWLHTNLNNEVAIGVIQPFTEYCRDTQYPLVLDLQREKNAYIGIENRDGVDAIGSPTGLTQSVLGLAQGAITSYRIGASVGGFVEADANINYLTANLYNRSYAPETLTGTMVAFNFFNVWYDVSITALLLSIETGYARYKFVSYTIGPNVPDHGTKINGQWASVGTIFTVPVGNGFSISTHTTTYIVNGSFYANYIAGQEYFDQFTVPSVNYQNGNQLTGKFIMPAASMQYNRNSSSIYENVSALGPKDIELTFSENSPFAVMYTGSQHCYLNAFDMNMTINRVEQKPLGYAYPKARAVMYPVMVEITTEATVSRYQADQLRKAISF